VGMVVFREDNKLSFWKDDFSEEIKRIDLLKRK